jgi:hypothetical protein
VGLGPGEHNVGWSDLALFALFIGFGAACVGAAPMLYGDRSAVSLALVGLGGLSFLGGAVSYLPLLKGDLARDRVRARRSDPPGFDLPLAPGRPVRPGRVWAQRAITIITPAIFWLVFFVSVTYQPTSWAAWGWLALCVPMTVAVLYMRYAVLTGVTDDGIELTGLFGTRVIRFVDIVRWSVLPSTRGGMPMPVSISTHRSRFAPVTLVPLFDRRLVRLLHDRVGPQA